MTKPSAPLILVDASSYLFRAFHAMPPLNNSKGMPTGAIKGVINMLRSLLKLYPESPMGIVFDAKGRTFRDDIFPEYKATRPPMPDELRVQIEPIHQIVKAMGLPLIVESGVEADDVIGTLATQATQAGVRTIISTGDKDMAQLVTEHVTLLNTMTNEELDVAGVEAKFGLPPRAIVDYLALMGDKVDNIPGVPSVGPKTAAKWLQEYKTLEILIAAADNIKGKVGEKLREHLHQLPLSKKLATIKCDVSLPYQYNELQLKFPAQDMLMELFSALEFRSWIQELESDGVTRPKTTSESIPTVETALPIKAEVINYQLINDDEAIRNICQKFQQIRQAAPGKTLRLGLFALATHEHYMESAITGLAISWEAGQSAYIPLSSGLIQSTSVTREALVEALGPILKDRQFFKVGYDLKLLSHLLETIGIPMGGRRYDTQLQAYVLNSSMHRHGMEGLVEQNLHHILPSEESVLGKGRQRIDFNALSTDKSLQFAAERADYLLRLSYVLEQALNTTGGLARVYRQVEIPLLPVLTRMETNGININIQALREQSDALGKRLQELEKKAFEIAGEEFNLGSPAQLQKILFEKLGLEIISKTDKGQPSTAEPVLQELAASHELPRVILEQRSLSKLKSTYTDRLPEEIQPSTHRIHSTFQQAVAATGRLSSTDPNLQNIPIRNEEGRRIRQAFVASPGSVLMAADYSQIELRIMAHLSEDKGLMSAFAQGLDVHRATAADIFGCPLEEVTAQQRRSAKAINFGLIYGMSAFGLANQLGIGRREAQDYVDLYFKRYPGVQDYMEQTRAQAAELGYVETLFGRRLYLPDIKARNPALRRAAERTAINAPMQGTAADLIKLAMIDIHNWLKIAKLEAKLVLQVHDELVFEVVEKDLNLLREGVGFRMVSAASLSVPLVVDIGHGVSWGQAHG